MKLVEATDRDARSGRALFLLCRCSNSPLYCRKVLSAASALLLLLLAGAARAAPQIELHSDTTFATAGYYQLTWSWPGAPADTNYALVEVISTETHSDSREIYQGPDLASVISGKRNGTYRYLVRAVSAGGKVLARSNPLKIVVSHHSLLRAWLVFTLGAVIFIATLLVILRESAKHR